MIMYAAMAHRATMAHTGRGKDIFRLRKQNTSRPPSMHVDDFMAMGVSCLCVCSLMSECCEITNRQIIKSVDSKNSVNHNAFCPLQSGRGRGRSSSHQLGVHPLMASVGNYQQMAAARWYAGAMGQQLERRSMSLLASHVQLYNSLIPGCPVGAYLYCKLLLLTYRHSLLIHHV